WSDWVNQPKIQAEYGIRLDANYYYWPGAWIQDRPGMFTGSGLPMRFAEMDGTLVDSYQAVTQITDESGQTYSTHINTLLDNALGPKGYYGAFTANMHTDLVDSPGSDVIVAAALQREVPVISAKQMLTWLDGRNNSFFTDIIWDNDTLSFTVYAAEGSKHLTGMLPSITEAGLLMGLTQNGNPVDFTLEVIKGIQYAFFPANNGHYEAVYGEPTNARLTYENQVQNEQVLSKEIKELSREVFLRVYPNPSSGGDIQVEAQGFAGDEEVLINLYNSVGGLEYSLTVTADRWGNVVRKLDFAQNLKSGVYIMMLQGKTNLMRHKILINSK